LSQKLQEAEGNQIRSSGETDTLKIKISSLQEDKEELEHQINRVK